MPLSAIPLLQSAWRIPDGSHQLVNILADNITATEAPFIKMQKQYG